MDCNTNAPHALNYFAILGPSQRILAYVSKKLHSSTEMLKNTGKAIAIHAIKSISSPCSIETNFPMVYYRTRHQVTAISTLKDPSTDSFTNNNNNNNKLEFTWILSFSSPYVLTSSLQTKTVHEYKDVPPNVMRALLRLAHANFTLLHGQDFQLSPMSPLKEQDAVDLDPLIQAYASLFIERIQWVMDLDIMALLFSDDPVLLPVTHTSSLSPPSAPSAPVQEQEQGQIQTQASVHRDHWILFRIQPTFAVEYCSDHAWPHHDILALTKFVFLHRTSPVVVYLPSSPNIACRLFLETKEKDHLLLRLHSKNPPPISLPPIPSMPSKHVHTFMLIPPSKARWPLDMKEARSISQVTHHLEHYNATRGAAFTTNKHWIAMDRVTGRGTVIASSTPSVSLSSVMEALLQQDMDDS